MGYSVGQRSPFNFTLKLNCAVTSVKRSVQFGSKIEIPNGRVCLSPPFALHQYPTTMTDTTTITIPTLTTPTAEQARALEMLTKALTLLSSSFGLKADALPIKGKRAGRKSKAAADASDAKPKRVLGDKIAALNEERMAVFNEMRNAWLERYPALETAARAAWAPDAPASAKAALKKAIEAAGADRTPSYPEALQEHSRRRAASDPEAAAKHAAYRAKVEADQAERRSQISGTKSDAASDAPAPTAKADKPKKPRAPRAKKNEAAAPSLVMAPPPAPAPAPTPVPEAAVTVVTADADDEEAFKTWTHKGTDYFKNGLNYVYRKTSKGGFGDYAGQYDPLKRAIDASVPEPEADDE